MQVLVPQGYASRALLPHCPQKRRSPRLAVLCVVSSSSKRGKGLLRVCSFSAQNYVRCWLCMQTRFPGVRAFLERPLRDKFPDSTFFEAALDEDTAQLAAGYDAACLFVNDTASAPVIERLAAGGIKFLAMRCAGFDRVDLAAAEAAGIRVARVPTYSPHSVAEHALAMLLCLNRNLHHAYLRVREGDYSLSGLVGFELRTKTVGIIGTGAIGLAACQIFRGFGSRVLAFDICQDPRAAALGVEYVTKERLLQEADIVSLHCPLLPSTRHMIDANSIAMMKPGAIIVNVARGGLVDTMAACDALESGQLGGLALDVYEYEGSLFFKNWTSCDMKDGFKVWDRKFQLLKSFPNVLISPHSAFLTHEALASIADTTVANLQAFEGGLHMPNEIMFK